MLYSRISRISLAAALVLVLAACGNNTGGLNNNGNGTSTEGGITANRVGPMGDGRDFETQRLHQMDRNNPMHQNTRAETSQELAESIAQIDGVSAASVLLTDNNAYVAVVIDRDAEEQRQNRTNMRGTSHNRNQMGNQNGLGGGNDARTGYEGQNGNGNQNGTLGRTGSANQNGTIGRTGSANQNGTLGRTGSGNQNGTVGRTGSGSQVGNGNQARSGQQADFDDRRLDNTRLKRHYDEENAVTQSLKEEIANEVKRYSPEIDNVFVSASPDFIDRMNGFVDQIQAGNPVRGLINEINTTMERLFPQNLAE